MQLFEAGDHSMMLYTVYGMAYYALFTACVLLLAFYTVLWIVIPRIAHKRGISLKRGWLSLRELEWKSTSSDTHAQLRTARIQTVHVHRIGVVVGKGSPKNTGFESYEASSTLSELASLKWGWVGIGASGVRVEVALTPLRGQRPGYGNEEATTHLEDVPVDATPMSRSSSTATALSQSGARSRSNSYSAASAKATTSQKARAYSLVDALRAFFYTTWAFHIIRRKVRRAIIDALPRRYRMQVARVLRFSRHRFLSPLLQYLNGLARRMNYLSALVAVEVKHITIDCPQIGASMTLDNVKAGLELVRGRHSHLSAWTRVEGLVAGIATPGNDKAKPRKRSSDQIKPLRVSGPVLVEARANFDNEIGIASLYHRNLDYELEPRKTILDLALSFPQLAVHHTSKGIAFGHNRRSSSRARANEQRQSESARSTKTHQHPSIEIRLDALLALAEEVKRVVQPDPHFGPYMKPHLHSRHLDANHSTNTSPYESDVDASHEHERYRTRPSSPEHSFPRHHRYQDPIKPKQNPAALLRSLTICIPLVKITTTFVSMSSDALQRDDHQRKVKGYTGETRLRGFALSCTVAPTLLPGDRHIEWFGKQAQLKAVGRVGFESVEAELASIRRDGHSNDPVKVLTLSPSVVSASTSWLPPRLDALFSPGISGADPGRTQRARDLALAENRSNSRLVVEADIGGMGGSVGIEMLEDLMRLIPKRNARWRHVKTSLTAPGPEVEEDKLPLHLYDPPVLTFGIELGQSEYRIAGPAGEPHRTNFGPGEDDANLSSGWSAPSSFALHVPSASAFINTQYVDVCLQRTDAQRREMRRLLDRGKLYVPEVLLPSNDSLNGAMSKHPDSPMRRSGRKTLWDGILAEESDSQANSQSPEAQSTPPPLSFSAKQQGDAGKAQRAVPPAAEAYFASNSRDVSDSVPTAFIAPHQPAAGAHNAPLAPQRQTEGELHSHPFVYKLEAGLQVETVQLSLWAAKDERIHNRTNPSNAGPSRKYADQHQHTASQQSQSKTSGRDRRFSRPANHTQLHIAHLGPATCATSLEFVGTEVQQFTDTGVSEIFSAIVDVGHKAGNVRLNMESLGLDISRFEVHHAVNGLLATLSGVRQERREHGEAESKAQAPETNEMHASAASHEHSEPPRAKPFITTVPQDIFVCVALADAQIVIAGPDPLYNPGVCRGLALRSEIISLEYICQQSHNLTLTEPRRRAALGLDSDIRSHANAQYSARPNLSQAFVRLTTGRISLNPVNDAGKGPKVLEVKSVVDNGTAEDQVEEAPTWEYKNRDRTFEVAEEEKRHRLPSDEQTSIAHALVKNHFDLPGLTARISIWAEHEKDQSTGAVQTVDHFGIRMHARSLLARPDLFQIYCFLLAISAFRSLKPQSSEPPAPSLRKPPAQRACRPAPVIQLEGDIDEIFVYLTLPHNVRMFAKVKRISVIRNVGSTNLKLENAIVAAASVMSPGHWEDILRMRDWHFQIANEPGNSGYHNHAIYASGSGARLRVPFKYPFSMIIDNTATFAKTIKQLLHQFVKGKYNSAIEPHAESAKHLPKITVSMKVLVIEAEDDPFETKLNLLFRVGKEEQIERLHRRRAFDDKLEEIRRQQASERAASSIDGSGDDKQDQMPRMSPEKAFLTLQRLNSTKWIQRHRNATATKRRREEAQLRRLHGSISALTTDGKLPIRLATGRNSAPLFRMVLDNPVVTISKPTFASKSNGLCDYLHDVGKGMPKDMKYSLLIPFHLDWRMAEARVQLRDYPLPLLHIPPMQQAHSDAKSWRLATDFIIAEELGGAESIRHVPAEIVPRSMAGGHTAYVRNIPRTAMPIKTYAQPVINIDSAWTTRVGWGNSIQPAIQDVMRVLDSITKPPPDPSDRVGFWDKLRLILHWRVQIDFVGEGPLHFILKGSRDPYNLEGDGAGFALCWRDQVRWQIGMPNEAREFFQIRSQDFVLGVPNLNDYRDAAATGVIRPKPQHEAGDDRSTAAQSGYSEGQHRANRSWQDLRKVCARFGGGVTWGFGARFERTCRPEDCSKCTGSARDRQCRFFDFKPHYTVKTIAGAEVRTGPHHDSYAGFRSDFVHLSVSVTANATSSSSANAIYLTPNGFTHFYAWWHLFDGTMSLPVRHGKLFPTAQAPSKKLGKHTATIKYRIQLAPVYIAHTYKQETWQDWRDGMTTVLGLKGRIGVFNVDLHQREQEERTWSEPLKTARKRLHKAFHRAEIDCKEIDARVIAARFRDERKADIEIGVEQEDTDMAELLGLGEDIADEDLPWVDLDDFRDLGVFVCDQYPQLRITPCFKAPRLTYSRYSQANVFSQAPDNDSAATGGLDGGVKPSKFGNEPTHRCLLDKTPDPLNVQMEFADERVAHLEARLREESRATSQATVQDIEQLSSRLRAAKSTKTKLQAYKQRRMSSKNIQSDAEVGNDTKFQHESSDFTDLSAFDDLDSWINRLVIHNPNMVVSQRIRDILLRYYFSSRQSRLFDYAMTARAIKFIKGLADGRGPEGPRRRRDALKSNRTRTEPGLNRTSSSTSQPHQPHQHESLLEKLLNDEGCNWSFRDKGDGASWNQSDSESQSSGGDFDLDPQTEAAHNLEEHWGVRNSFLVSLICPQLAFNSDTSSSSTILLASVAVNLRVFTIVDEHHLDDPINATVMHRSFGSIDNLQAFYPHLSGWRSGGKQAILRHMHNFVPVEVLTGDAQDTEDLDRIVPKTSARLRYDKHNRLRLQTDVKRSQKQSVASKLRSTLDRLSFECERFSVSAMPKHYAAIYDVVTNLILYTDPAQKAKLQRVERVVLSKDFSNQQEMANNVQDQQEELRRIRRREEAWFNRGYNQLSEEELDDAYLLRVEELKRMDQLTLWMGALQSAQDNKATSRSMGMQMDARASEIVWHMRDDVERPIVKIGVKGVAFRWLNRQDGNVANCLVISDLNALNSSPEHVFPEIISKYPTPSNASPQVMRSDIFAAVLWSMLPPVGGIAIIDRFEVHLHPIRLQIEQKIGKQIQEYLFSQKSRKGEGANGDTRSLINQKQSSASNHSGPGLRAMRSTDSLNASNRLDDSRSINSDDGSSFLSPSVATSRSQGSGSNGSRQLRRVPSVEDFAPTFSKTDDHLDADEMRERSRLNRTFLHVEIHPTVLNLSFKGDKQTSLYDVYGLIYKSPTIIHCNRIWSYGELVNSVKKDFKSSIWSQSATLIGQILTTARHKPRNAANAVQQRLLGAVGDKDRSTASQDSKRKSLIGAQFRSRTVSGSSAMTEDHKTSPLRTVTTSHDNSGDESSDDDTRDASLNSAERHDRNDRSSNVGQQAMGNTETGRRSTKSLELAPSLLRKSLSRLSAKDE